MMEEAGPVGDNKIFELTEIYDERSGQDRRSTDRKNPQPIIMVDGRGYERVKLNGRNIYDLTEVIEESSLTPQLNELVMKQAIEIIEKIARDVIPDIAERVIREEIEKIKTMNKEQSSDLD